MSKIATAERVSLEKSDNFVFQRSLLAYHHAAEIIGGEIEKYRTGGVYAEEFPDRWLPAALAIVDEAFTEQNGLVNSTMKVVRGKVEEYHKGRIDYMYTPEGKMLKNDKNLESLAKLVA